MRVPSFAKSVVWASLLSWPWVVMFVARNSPEMILKGRSESTSFWMPLIADILLIAGGLFAFHTRRRTVDHGEATPRGLYGQGHHLGSRTSRVTRKAESR